jgi:hypothetical protein
MGTELLPTVVALVSGVLSIPICYVYTLMTKSLSPIGMLGVAVAIMAGMIAIYAFLTKGKVKNKMCYGKVHITNYMKILEKLIVTQMVKKFYAFYGV